MQEALHGGAIAAILDVSAGLVYVTTALTRNGHIAEEELKSRLLRKGTIDLRVKFLSLGLGVHFIASSSLL